MNRKIQCMRAAFSRSTLKFQVSTHSNHPRYVLKGYIFKPFASGQTLSEVKAMPREDKKVTLDLY